MSPAAGRLVVLAALAVLVTGLIVAALGGSPTLEGQAHAVAASLKCPACAGESVADSAAPIAESMRIVIAERLQAGESPAAVRAWFAERYGQDVLLDPGIAGHGVLLWAVPIALVAVVALVLLRRRETAFRWVAAGAILGTCAALTVPLVVSGGAAAAGGGSTDGMRSGATVLERYVADAPDDGQLLLATARALEDDGRLDEALPRYAAAARLLPDSAEAGYRLGSALARTERQEEAVDALNAVLDASPDHLPTMLLLGTLLWWEGDPRGEQMLSRFLSEAPDHPARAEVEEMLASPAEGQRRSVP